MTSQEISNLSPKAQGIKPAYRAWSRHPARADVKARNVGSPPIRSRFLRRERCLGAVLAGYGLVQAAALGRLADTVFLR